MTLNFCNTLYICETDVVTAVYAFKIGDGVLTPNNYT